MGGTGLWPVSLSASPARCPISQHLTWPFGVSFPYWCLPVWKAGFMGHWRGDTFILQVGSRWAYVLRLAKGRSHSRVIIIPTQETFSTRAQARAAGKRRLKAELDRRNRAGKRRRGKRVPRKT